MILEFLKKHRRIFIISLIIFCILLIALTAANKADPTLLGKLFSNMTVPLQSGITKSGNWVNDRLGFFKDISEITEENRRLKDQIATLQVENSRLKQVDAENEALAALLETKRKYADYPMEKGQVSSRDPGNWYYRFIIDIGANDGIQVNMVVLADGALIGRIARVWPNAARVDSIIDDYSAVSAKSKRTNDIGIVRGDAELMLEGMCLMEFTDLNVDIEVGDEIVTSQLSSIYPPEIVIGKVKSVITDSKGMKRAVIEPVADFSLVEYVLVITKLYDVNISE